MWSSESFRQDGEHLPLTSLKQELRRLNIDNKYMEKSRIPTFPRPELSVSHVSHSTDLQGLRGVCGDGGFRDPQGPSQELKVVWFSLTPSLQDLIHAEQQDMTLVHPGGHEQPLSPGGWDRGDGGYNGYGGYGGDDDALEGPLLPRGKLRDFATSPAFSSSFRYGSFRFTFSLGDVLDEYSQQFCGGQRPVLRVFRTVLYKQEVMYAMLVHRPKHNKRFRHRFPKLHHSSICSYSPRPQPQLTWRPQAMSATHRIGLKQYDDGTLFTENQHSPQFYVWDHVALALHVGHKVLRFTDQKLKRSLRFCERAPGPNLRNDLDLDFSQAKVQVQDLWPGRPLRRFNCSTKFHIQE